jgi:hypothetical protein
MASDIPEGYTEATWLGAPSELVKPDGTRQVLNPGDKAVLSLSEAVLSDNWKTSKKDADAAAAQAPAVDEPPTPAEPTPTPSEG